MSASPALQTAQNTAVRHSSSPSSASVSSAHPAPTMAAPSSSPTPMGAGSTLGNVCMWENCTHRASDPEMLYIHLCNDHIGRKSTGNLCLTCKWKDCGVSCAKRDHITSHLRVHTPLKPHTCEICNKAFKRPQDLKKHEKIHTAEHHTAHKHSKAQLAPESALGQQHAGVSPHSSASLSPEVGLGGTPPRTDGMGTVRRSPQQAQSFAFSVPSASHLTPHAQTSSYLSLPAGVPLSHSPSLSPHSPGLLTPANLSPYPVHQQNYNAPPAQMGTTGTRNGYDERENKRVSDGLEDFFNDAKRRRYGSGHDNAGKMYDETMAARLNQLSPGFLQSQPGQQLGGFGQAMNTAVQTEADLAQINGALLQLHKAISGSNGFDSSGHDLSHASDALISDQELAALGLVGMPGIGLSGYADSGSGYVHGHGQYAMPVPAHQSQAARYAQQSMQHQHPHAPVSPSPHQQYSFSHYPQLVPQLGASDAIGMSGVRTERFHRLREAPSPMPMSPSAMDVELSPSATRSRSRSPSPSMLRNPRRVYEDPELKLPAISSPTAESPGPSPGGSRPPTASGARGAGGRRTSLPPISALNITESEKRALPTRLYPRLPPLASILPSGSPVSPSPVGTPTQAPAYARSGSARPTGERLRHAKLVKDMLVMVNREWQRRERGGDVEMSS